MHPMHARSFALVAAAAVAVACSVEDNSGAGPRLPARGDAGSTATTNDAGRGQDAAPPATATPDAAPPPARPTRCDDSFEDVGATDDALASIRAIYVNGISDGCSETPRRFCPNDPLTRTNAAVLLVRALREQPSAAASNANFDDLGADTAAPSINRLVELGITTGCGARLYCPTSPLTREQMATFLVRALKEQPSTAAANMFFDDVGASVHAGAINRLKELSITNGCAERKYCPADPLSRAQAAMFLARAFKISADICNR